MPFATARYMRELIAAMGTYPDVHPLTWKLWQEEVHVVGRATEHTCHARDSSPDQGISSTSAGSDSNQGFPPQLFAVCIRTKQLVCVTNFGGLSGLFLITQAYPRSVEPLNVTTTAVQCKHWHSMSLWLTRSKKGKASRDGPISSAEPQLLQAPGADR